MVKTYEMTNYQYGKLIQGIQKEWIIEEMNVRISVKRVTINIPEYKVVGDPTAQDIHRWIVNKGIKEIIK